MQTHRKGTWFSGWSSTIDDQKILVSSETSCALDVPWKSYSDFSATALVLFEKSIMLERNDECSLSCSLIHTDETAKGSGMQNAKYSRSSHADYCKYHWGMTSSFLHLFISIHEFSLYWTYIGSKIQHRQAFAAITINSSNLVFVILEALTVRTADIVRGAKPATV